MSKRKSFADVRGDIIETIDAIRRREIPASDGLAIFAGYRELHNNVQVEINAAKMALATEGKAHSFGKVVRMGKRVINGDDGDDES
jgi:hypothetical protein